MTPIQNSWGHLRRSAFAKVFVLIVFLFPCTLAQEKALKVVYENGQAHTGVLATVRYEGSLYASLKDLSQILSLSMQEDFHARTLTLKNALRQVIFTADNPFVIVNEKGNREALSRQLPGDVVYSARTWYIPVASSAPLFEKVFGIRAAYAEAGGTLFIGNNVTLPKPVPVKPKFDIPAVELETKANGTLIRVVTTRQFTDFEHIQKQDGWLYVIIPNARADVAAINKTKPAGGVKKILAIQSPTSVQLTFKLDDKIISSDVSQDERSNAILISLRGASDEAQVVTQERKKLAVLDDLHKKYELDVIVLDAGHGGKDPGTIGVTGTKEKDVALGIVLKLGRLIRDGLKGVKVVYTRDDDTFIELDRRGQIANSANGKLFISVHCNAMPHKPNPSRGFEVYLLRPGRTDEAINIAERENSVIEMEEGYERRYQKLTDENFILVTMAQSAHMRASEVFAEITAKEMNKNLPTPDKGVKQAGFLVLVGSAMPNVLIETAYLSNRQDEKLLKSDAGQQQYAEAIFKAIKRYKEEYEKLLQEGRDLGEK